MDSQHETTPVGGTFSLGFADLAVMARADGTVVASGFFPLEVLADGLSYRSGELPDVVTDALAAWLDRDYEPLMRVPVERSGTPRIAQMRETLRGIPAGQVVTYSQLAEQAGLPGLSRLAGRACSGNPCLLFVPCHRVVAASHIGPPVIAGSYAGTGAVKAHLLAHEGVAVADPDGIVPGGDLPALP